MEHPAKAQFLRDLHIKRYGNARHRPHIYLQNGLWRVRFTEDGTWSHTHCFEGKAGAFLAAKRIYWAYRKATDLR